MDSALTGPMVLVIALLTVFLSYLVVLRYVVRDNFARTRASMTSFFAFIVATLTVSFWPYALQTLPYTVPAFTIGAILGHFIGVEAAEERHEREGHEHYVRHFAHIHAGALKNLSWWAFANFYTVAGALVLINLVGFSTVIMQSRGFAIGTSVVGAFLLGSIAPYLVHLWKLGKR